MVQKYVLSTKKLKTSIWIGVLFCGCYYLILRLLSSPESTIKKEKCRIVFLPKELGNYEPTYVEDYLGNGANGKGYEVPQSLSTDVKESLDMYGMNMLSSDQIGYDRTIYDSRAEQCKHFVYPILLPTATVIIIFYNEGASVLLRTVNSIINRSPPSLLKEILLIDDFSSRGNLTKALKAEFSSDDYVRILTNKERLGLIRSRTYAASIAKGEVIIFIDAHCEVNINWLAPLLQPISEDRHTMTVPIIDNIDAMTFAYRRVYSVQDHYRGIFEWGLVYKESKLPYREAVRRDYDNEPYNTPTHHGGMFAIDKSYFLSLGAYDPGLLVWGGENMELSFKVWQCGGRILTVPCSRVGHVSKISQSFSRLHLDDGPLTTRNYKRVVEVWFDEKHKRNFNIRHPLAKWVDVGDISNQLALKKRLKCKNFDWYLNEVAYEIETVFPDLPENLHWGQLKSAKVDKCIEASNLQPFSPLTVADCHDQWVYQTVRLNAKGQLGIGDGCIVTNAQGKVLVMDCPRGSAEGPWQYNTEKHTIVHEYFKSQCLVLDEPISLAPCTGALTEQWFFKFKT